MRNPRITYLWGFAMLELTRLEERDTPAVSTYGGLVNLGNGGGGFAPWAGYSGGLNVALAGDANGDGFEDVLIAATEGGGPRVSLIDGRTHAALDNFFAFESTFRGGCFVAFDGTENAAYVGAGPGGGPVGVKYQISGGKLVEVSRQFYGDPNGRTGVRFDANSESGKPLEYTVGSGRYAIYLQLEYLRGFQAKPVVDAVYSLFAGVKDLIRVTTVKPNQFPGTYLTVWTQEDFGYTGFGNAEGFASRNINNQPASGYDPAIVHVSKTVPYSRLASVAAHEAGHWFGLPHSEKTGNIMLPTGGVGNTFNDPIQVQTMAANLRAFDARRPY